MNMKETKSLRPANIFNNVIFLCLKMFMITRLIESRMFIGSPSAANTDEHLQIRRNKARGQWPNPRSLKTVYEDPTPPKKEQ